jgi:hypothetical protein
MLGFLRRGRSGRVGKPARLSRKSSSDLKRLVALWEELARDRKLRGRDFGREAA